MNMGNYGYLSAKPHAVTRVDNTDYLKASASRQTTYNAFAKATRLGSTTYGFSPYYYNKDHLGNIREVVNMGGTVQQVTNYYPFGAPYADPNAVMGATVQPYKYIFSIEREKRKLACSSEREKKRQKVNGKELDRVHGLNTYDSDPYLGPMDEFGRMVEVHPTDSTVLYLEGSVPPNYDEFILRNAIVPMGASFRLQGTMRFMHGATLTVMPGGYLLIDGGSLITTNLILHPGSRIVIDNGGEYIPPSNSCFNAPYGVSLWLLRGTIY